MSATDLVVAVRAGDIGEVKRLLTADPSLARARVEQRTMLHHATDWPGHPPNVATVIRSLVEAGADVHATCPHPDNPLVAETPLHWAASSNDLDASAALLDAGADVDAVGGIFDGCTPLVEAVVFENYEAAAMLLERGATSYLPAEAALGRLEEVRACFDDAGDLDERLPRLPHWDSRPAAQLLLDRAFQFACRAGHLETARFLRDRGAVPGARLPPGTTAIEEARSNGHADVVTWLAGLE